MIQLINPRIRIALVLVAAFIVSSILYKYSTPAEELTTPKLELALLASDFSHSLSNTGNSLLSSLQSIQLPTTTPDITTEVPTQLPTQPNQDWVTVPTSEPLLEFPTSTPAVLPSPTEYIQKYPTTYNPQPTSIPKPSSRPQPTSIPKPTKAPAPTKVPKPTVIVYPGVTSDIRPGSSIEEILQDVAKRMCVPYRLLIAIRTIESGAWFKNMTPTTTKFYNTYGWWKSAGVGEICAGLAYYTQTGVIPPDSTGAAGGTCPHAPFGGGTVDQKIMGLFQVSEDEEKVSRKNTTKALPKSIDRRVLFDNAIIFASITKNRAGQSPQPSCDDWPEETVKEVAGKHYGSCSYPGGNYCNEVWGFYKSAK